MRGEILKALQVQVSREIDFGLGQRIVSVNPLEPRWDDIELANHNVFRLNKRNEVVWQVRRVENTTRMPWDQLHARAKQKHAEGSTDGRYTASGYLDPFTSMGLDESAAIHLEPKGVWRHGCVVYLLTRSWSYVLDSETGIATCTGDQVK